MPHRLPRRLPRFSRTMLREIAFEPDVEQFKSRIHFDSLDEDSQQEALEVAQALVLKPVFGGYSTTDIRFISDFCAEIEGIRFEGRRLCLIREARTVAPWFATCASEEKCQDPLRQFWVEELKLQALKVARHEAFKHFSSELGCNTVSSINPGSGVNSNWEISQLIPLFELFHKHFSSLPARLADSCFMLPQKSVAGILFKSDSEIFSCSECKRPNCPERKAEPDII